MALSAGSDLTNVEPWTRVVLSGTDDAVQSSIVSRVWTQTGGSPTVTLNGNNDVAYFEAPGTINGTTLTFQYSTTNTGGTVVSDTMTVGVLPVTERAVIGMAEVPVRFARAKAGAKEIKKYSSSSYVAGGSITSLNIPLGDIPSAGSLLLGFWTIEDASGAFTPPAGWTTLGGNSGLSVSLWCAYKVAAGNETTADVSWVSGRAGVAGVVKVFTDVDTTTPIGGFQMPAYSDVAATSAVLDPPTTTFRGTAVAAIAWDSAAADGSPKIAPLIPVASGFVWKDTVFGSHASTPALTTMERDDIAPNQNVAATTFTWGRSDQSQAMIVVINGKRPGEETSEIIRGTPYYSGSTVTYAGATYTVHTPNKYYSYEGRVDPISPTYGRFELLAGEQWSLDKTEHTDGRQRSMVSGTTKWPFGTNIWSSGSFRLSASSLQGGANATNNVFHFYQDRETGEVLKYAVMGLSISGGSLVITTMGDLNVATTTVPPVVTRYTTPWTLTGQWVNFVCRTRFSKATQDGQLQVWINGNQAINLTGILMGHNDAAGPYARVGIYRSAYTEPVLVEWANIEVGTASLLSRVATPLALPTAGTQNPSNAGLGLAPLGISSLGGV